MEYKEFREEICKITNWDTSEMYFTSRLLGCCYKKFMYKKAFLESDKIYQPEEVLSAFKNSWKFTKDFKKEEYKDGDYYNNILISYTKKNLDKGYYDEVDYEISDDYIL